MRLLLKLIIVRLGLPVILNYLHNSMLENLTSQILYISKLPRNINKNSDFVLEKSNLIIDNINLKIDKLYKGYESMSLYLYPNGDANKLIDSTVFFNILYYFDEIYGEDSMMPESKDKLSIEDILGMWSSNNKYIENPLSRGIDEIKRILNKSNKSFANKILQTLLSHIKHSLKSIRFSTIDEYIVTRLEFSGMYLSIDMMEYVYNFELTDKDISNFPEILQLRTLCARIGALSNDIFSYPKELHSSTNLIKVLINLEDLDEDAAILKSIDIVNNDFKSFENIRKSLFMKENSTHLSKYVNGLLDVVSASYHWQKDTQRYKHPLHFFLDMK